jgi:hypothetical protein
MLISPVRMLLISVPVKAIPASNCSSHSYSNRARRFSNVGVGAGGRFGFATAVGILLCAGTETRLPKRSRFDVAALHEATLTGGE